MTVDNWSFHLLWKLKLSEAFKRTEIWSHWKAGNIKITLLAGVLYTTFKKRLAGGFRFITQLVKVKVTHTRHEFVWRNRVLAPLILNLGTRWKWASGFKPWPLYPCDNNYWINSWVVQRARLNALKKRWTCCPYLESKHDSIDVHPVVQSLCWLHHPGIWIVERDCTNSSNT
jgi:hypothetical protein